MHGTAISTHGTSASDQGLQPGKQYTYSLYTQLKGRWVGPLIITVQTGAAPGSSAATYVASSTTLLAKATDLTAAETTGTGVKIVLRPGLPAPLAGAGVVFPISNALPGGFLGVVTSVATDGRTVNLGPVG